MLRFVRYAIAAMQNEATCWLISVKYIIFQLKLSFVRYIIADSYVGKSGQACSQKRHAEQATRRDVI